MTAVAVRPIQAADQAAWRPLFDGYCVVYEREPDDARTAAVWSWLMDEQHRFTAWSP